MKLKVTVQTTWRRFFQCNWSPLDRNIKPTIISWWWCCTRSCRAWPMPFSLLRSCDVWSAVFIVGNSGSLLPKDVYIFELFSVDLCFVVAVSFNHDFALLDTYFRSYAFTPSIYKLRFVCLLLFPFFGRYDLWLCPFVGPYLVFLVSLA